MGGLSKTEKEFSLDRLETVSDIVNLMIHLKDPQNIDKLKESVVALNDLSESEKVKHDQARDLIEQHRKILEENKGILAEHDKKYKAFTEESAKTRDEFIAITAQQNQRDTGLMSREKMIKVREQKSTEKEAALKASEDRIKAREDAVFLREGDIKQRETANANLKARLDARYAALTKPLD